MQTPREMVESFWYDYYKWNKAVYEASRDEKDNSGKAMDMAVKKYQKLILDKYCKLRFKGQPIAFGSDSNHEAGKEIVVFEEISKSRAIVRTKHTDSYDFISDYEYRFHKTGNRWYLEALDYVDGDSKYPSL